MHATYYPARVATNRTPRRAGKVYSYRAAIAPYAGATPALLARVLNRLYAQHLAGLLPARV